MRLQLVEEVAEWCDDCLSERPRITSFLTDEMRRKPMHLGGDMVHVRVYRLMFTNSVDAVLFSLRWL